MAFKSPLKTRQLAKCNNCKLLKQNLRDMREKQLKIQRDRMIAIRNLRMKQKDKRAKKTLNQKIKRKNEQIERHKSKLSEFSSAKKTVSSITKKHTQLKKYYKESKKSLKFEMMAQKDKEAEERIVNRERKLAEREKEIVQLQRNQLLLEEKVKEMESVSKAIKSGGKSYNSEMRMMVFDAVENQVPTSNIPKLIEKFSIRNGVTLQEIPHRSSVENMIRELGAIAELQTAEAILQNPNTTLGFDATTQEGTHINSVHFTTVKECFAAAIDELPGGMAEDYSGHICDTINNLASTHSYFHDGDYNETREKLITNIANTLTDRCAANHAAIQMVNQAWNKELNELNCHLHPLDSIATKTRSTLKGCEEAASKQLFGKDCIAGNLVLGFNKMRYKDGKGDPKGFILFLEKENLARGLLPRYRGNRLHVLFHICGTLHQHYLKFLDYLQKGTSCGGLRSAILKDFNSITGQVEIQVLGLIGKFLTGPWMKFFYRGTEDHTDHLEGILLVKDVITHLKNMHEPLDLFKMDEDFFGDKLNAADATLKPLKQPPEDANMFSMMMHACLAAVTEVLDRQYRKYFTIEVTEILKEETKPARAHNIDAEEIMGMFSAAQNKAPNATLCFLSSKLRAQKNGTVAYLDKLPKERRDTILKKAVKLGQLQRKKRKLKQKDLMKEMAKRQVAKQQMRETTERNKLERRLKNTPVEEIATNFPDLDTDKLEQVTKLVTGKCVGDHICHLWYEEKQQVMYNGKIESFKPKKKSMLWHIGLSMKHTMMMPRTMTCPPLPWQQT